MMVFFIIVCLLIIFFPYLMRLGQRLMYRRVEKMFRRAAGMDTDKKKRKEEKREQSRTCPKQEPIIPKEYAEDVEFVETRVFSEEVKIESTEESDGNRSVKIERQVSDVEWEEIK